MLIQNKVNIGLGMNDKVAPCLLQSPSPEMLCDDVRRVKSTGHAAEQCPVERTWTGATSQEDARGRLTTWSYKPNYLQFFYSLLHFQKLHLCCIPMKHLRFPTRLRFPSGVNFRKHNNHSRNHANIKEAEDAQEV